MRDKRASKSVQYILLIVLLIVLAFSVVQMDKFWKVKEQEQPQRIKEAIEKACVQCYALEGSYPPDLEYLGQHYGLVLDHERYFYFYEVFASNIMPDVEVYEKGK
jgi:hypothetical protein